MSGQWTYDKARGEYVCSYPRCKYRHANLGAMQLHWRRKDHVASLLAGAAPAGQDQAAAGGACPECGATSWRLLRSTHPKEQAAIDLGYKEVCTKCLELR